MRELDPLEYGRFGVHLGSNAFPDFCKIDEYSNIEIECADGRKLVLRNAEVRCYFMSGGVGAVEVSSPMSRNLQSAIFELSVMCHERFGYTLDGLPLVDWVRNIHPAVSNADISKDVLQVVTVDHDEVLDFKVNGELQDSVGSVIMRDVTLSRTYAASTLRTPDILNRQLDEFAAHGRGVVFLGGHRYETNNMLSMVALQGILVSTHLRSVREELTGLLEVVKSPSGGSAGDQISIDEFRQRNHRLRVLQAELAIDVSPVISGLEAPDLIADRFRDSFHGSLNLKELFDDGKQLVSTLSSTADTVLRELEYSWTETIQARDTRWQFIVGVASGIVVPIALTLSYFSVTASEIDPERSMFDAFYAPVWTVTSVSMLSIILASAVAYVYRRKKV